MTATIAIFIDAYRELCAKRLFWFVLALTGAVVGAFALIDINEKGLLVLTWQIDAPFLNTTSISRETFYKMMFVNLGVAFWLSWAAAILALVSTASIIPDFLAGGAVELTLSKPISRVRLFLTKYAAGLLFVALQVLVFSLGSFLIIGFKGGAWEPGLFLAIPIVLAFFSFLYCLCALFGLLTRSTIASLLLTLVCWFLFSILGLAETSIGGLAIAAEKQVQATQQEINVREKRIAAVRNGEHTQGFLDALTSNLALPDQERKLEEAKADLEEQQASARIWQRWRTGLFIAKTVLPKTSETIALLERGLMTPDEVSAMIERAQNEAKEQRERQNRRRATVSEESTTDPDEAGRVTFDNPEVQLEVAEQVRERSIWWVLGTSLGFEAVVLGLACWIFARKDF